MTITAFKTTRTRTGALFVALVVGLSAACGGGGGGSDEAQIENLAEDFFEAAVKGEGNNGYSMLSSESKKTCPESEFNEQVKESSEFIKALGTKVELKRVYDINIDGDTATAKIEITVAGESADQDESVGFVKEGGKWKIDDAC